MTRTGRPPKGPKPRKIAIKVRVDDDEAARIDAARTAEQTRADVLRETGVPKETSE